METLYDELESMVCRIDIIKKKKKREGKGLQPIYKFCINLIMMQLYQSCCDAWKLKG